jgi:hypothetical protein
MADRILDREKHPEWNGERSRMVRSFPTAEKLWEQYRELRADNLRRDGTIAEATAFYREHQAEMDAGAEVSWPERFNHDEISAIQHAMNLRFQDEAAFWAEYQNEPLPEDLGQEDDLTVDDICARLNGHSRRRVPIGATCLTAFIDIQRKALFWVVCAWEPDFTGYVVDYGTFPKQPGRHFALRDVRHTLARAKPGAGIEGAIYHGLEQVAADLLSGEWRRDDGALMQVDRCLVDANWGQSTDVVYQFCRQSPHAARLLPSHGRYVGASSIPFSEYHRKPGDRIGLNWRVPLVTGKRAIRHVLFDTNFWKSFLHARLSVPMGDRGCLSLYGKDPEHHRLWAEHVTAEYRVKTEGRGRVVDEWKLRPEAADNHWLDGVVGCCVGAGMCGVVLGGTESGISGISRERIRLSSLQHRPRGVP